VFVLDAHPNPSWEVRHLHGTLGLVAVLPARTRPSTGLPLDVLVLDAEVVLPRLFKDSDSDGRGLHSASLVVRWDTLPTVSS